MAISQWWRCRAIVLKCLDFEWKFGICFDWNLRYWNGTRNNIQHKYWKYQWKINNSHVSNTKQCVQNKLSYTQARPSKVYHSPPQHTTIIVTINSQILSECLIRNPLAVFVNLTEMFQIAEKESITRKNPIESFGAQFARCSSFKQ